MRVFCWLGIHKDKFESIVVHKNEHVETSNCRWVCVRCNRKTAWTGSTTFGPITFNITTMKEEIKFKSVDILRQDPTLRSRMILAIENIINENTNHEQ